MGVIPVTDLLGFESLFILLEILEKIELETCSFTASGFMYLSFEISHVQSTIHLNIVFGKPMFFKSKQNRTCSAQYLAGEPSNAQ